MSSSSSIAYEYPPPGCDRKFRTSYELKLCIDWLQTRSLIVIHSIELAPRSPFHHHALIKSATPSD